MRAPFVAVVTAVLTIGAGLTAAPAATAAPRGTIALESWSVESTPPLRTRPLWDQCAAGGLNRPYCGLGTVTMTLSGFAAHGGVPDDGEEAVADVTAGTFGTRVDVLVRCTGSPFPTVRSVPVVTEPGLYPSGVGASTRVDDDTATVSAIFFLPGPQAIGACPEPDTTNLWFAGVRSLTVGFDSHVEGLPDWTTRVPGLHRVPSS